MGGQCDDSTFARAVLGPNNLLRRFGQFCDDGYRRRSAGAGSNGMWDEKVRTDWETEMATGCQIDCDPLGKRP